MSSAIKQIVVLGDSQTDYSAGYGTDAFDMHPPLLARSLREAGYSARVRGFGVSGDTSLGVLGRVSDAFFYGTPDVAVVYIGVNDPGASISTALTQAYIQAIVKALKHKAIGDRLGSGSSVADQTALPDNGRLGDRYVVLNDTSTTGGIAAFDAAHHATITGTVAADANGQKQTVWEYRQGAAGDLGWGRVATNATAPLRDASGNLPGVKTIVVCSTNYLNFTTGGDTPSTPYATYASVRTAQQAAATAENGNGATVTYADLYTLQKGLIQAGTVPDFSAVAYDQTKSWHYTQNNQHHNRFGNSLVAQALRAGVVAGL